MSYPTDEVEGMERRRYAQPWSRDWAKRNERLHLAERTLPGWLIDLAAAVLIALCVVGPVVW